ncbi:hypothetical protein JOD02_001993 [Caldicoprobacter guelmensis]|nr:hypothetical protein [Caldicoprobacter guelmensis]MBM7583116.1 hypothetical protein [Caldicoprobacter guelmensis]
MDDIEKRIVQVIDEKGRRLLILQRMYFLILNWVLKKNALHN